MINWIFIYGKMMEVMTNPFGAAILNFVVMVIDIDILFYWNFSETSQKKSKYLFKAIICFYLDAWKFREFVQGFFSKMVLYAKSSHNFAFLAF